MQKSNYFHCSELKQSQATRLDDYECFFKMFQSVSFQLSSHHSSDIHSTSECFTELKSWMSFLRNTKINQWKWYMKWRYCIEIFKPGVLFNGRSNMFFLKLIISFSMILWQQSSLNCWQWSNLTLLPYLSLLYLHRYFIHIFLSFLLIIILKSHSFSTL